LKTWPQFWLNPLSKFLLGMALSGSCLSQDAPLSTPKTTQYPGLLQTFEKLISIDSSKLKTLSDGLIKNGASLPDQTPVLELQPDFLNSVIMHSNSGYLKLASTSKCRFYDTIITDLLKSAEGKIKNVIVTYEGKTSLLSKKEFLNRVVIKECPETTRNIDQFQIKSLSQTISSIHFEVPTGRDQCRNLHLSWINNPQTAYLCQIHEYVNEARAGLGDPSDLNQRRTLAKIIQQKLTVNQLDYIDNLCTNLAHEDLFCDDFLNVSFWNKVASGLEEPIYAEGICKNILNSSNVTPNQINQCLVRMKKEDDLCLYASGPNSGLAPQPECQTLSLALNNSNLRSNYADCPASSDQLLATNEGRLLLNVSKEDIKGHSGPCSVISAAQSFLFNEKFDNDENWNLEACWDDKLNQKEVCHRTFFGNYNNHPMSYTNVVAQILKNARGAESNLICTMVDSKEYNPMLLNFKSGCYIIYESNQCYISECKHKVIYNDRPVDLIKIKNRVPLEYFPLSIKSERFSFQYIFTTDFKQKGHVLNNLSAIGAFFKKSRQGIIHGIGCGEDLLPSFMKSSAINQCTPIPFIIDGIIKNGENIGFVTRTGADTLQAPRILSWSAILSGLKSYQNIHPMKQWTLYGLD